VTDMHRRSAGVEPEVRRVVRSWLSEERHEDASRVLGVVLNGLDTAPQRRAPGSAWRTSFVSTTMRYGLAAAAVVIVAFIGYKLVGGSNVGGPRPTETAQPTATATATAAPTGPADGSYPAGSSFALWDGQRGTTPDLGIKIIVTIPATGWSGFMGEGVIYKNLNAHAPDGASLTVFARTNDLLAGLGDVYVYGDPCHWATTKPGTPVKTVDEAIAALSAQPSRDASAPTDVTYDGYAGKYMTLHVPDDAVFSECDKGQFRTLVQGGDAVDYAEDPGQFDLLTVLDVKGQLVIFDAAYYAGTPSSVLDEIAHMVESAVFSYAP